MKYVVDASIAVEVLAAIMARETTRASSAPMSKLESYTLLFAAIALMDRWTRNSFLKSRELLSELRQRAPLHALPCAWRSAWHIRSISQGWTTDAAADARAALEFAERSLDSDPNCSILLAMEGWANVYASRRLDLAANRLLRAVEVNPSDSLAWLLKGVTHAFCGEGQDAADAAERALRLSPLDPRRSYFESMAAGANLAAHRFERTIELATSSLRANSQHPSTLRALATGLWYSDRPEQARKCVEQMLALEPSFSVSRYRGSHPASGQPVIELVAEALAACGAPA